MYFVTLWRSNHGRADAYRGVLVRKQKDGNKSAGGGQTLVTGQIPCGKMTLVGSWIGKRLGIWESW